MKYVYVAVAAFAAASLSVAASAENAANPFAASQLQIRTADLDLSTPQGQASFNARLSQAATNVCGISVSHLHSTMAPRVAQCRAEVIADARQQLASRQAKAQQASLQQAAGTAQP